MGFIPADQLVDRGLYRIKSRNLVLGFYRAEARTFVGIRTKFGSEFLDEEILNDPPGTGTAMAEEFWDVVLGRDVLLATLLPGSKCKHERWCEYVQTSAEGEPRKGFWKHLDDDSPVEGDDYPHALSNTVLFNILKPPTEAEHERWRQEYERWRQENPK